MFKNLSISKKLLLSFGFFIVLFIILFALNFYFSTHNKKFLNLLDERVEKKINNAVLIRREILAGIQMHILEMLATRDPKVVEEGKKRIAEARENYFKALDEIKKLTRTQEGLKLLKEVEDTIADLRGYNNKVLELISAGRWDEAVRTYDTECIPRVAKMEKVLDEQVKFHQRRFNEEMKAIETTMFKQQVVITVFSILAIILGILFGIGISRSITKPTGYLVEVLKKVREGELGIDLKVDRKDEIGTILASLKEALEGMKRVLSQARDISLSLAGSSEELSAIVSQVRGSAKMQAEKATQIASSAEEMSATIVDVAKNTNEISSAGVETAKIAGEGRVMAERTAEEIRVIESSADKVLSVISELEGRARQIGNIVVMIKDIADQTNLLALNATIEAARAGEHGRSFAVVAGEIRKLAEKANEASDEIASMIREVQVGTESAKRAVEETVEKVGKGVELSVKASEVLREIEHKAEDLKVRIQQIASATEQMSAVVDQITGDIGSIAESAKEVSRAVEDTAKTAEAVAKMGTELKIAIERFKL